MAGDIESDPRFRHILTDPRFKSVPKRTRKVHIGSRFQSMFTDKRFKVKYRVDRRGRRVKQSSSEDMRRYYHINTQKEGDTINTQKEGEMENLEVTKQSDRPVSDEEKEEVHISDAVARGNNEECSEESSSSDSEGSTDIEDLLRLEEPQVVHPWAEEATPTSEAVEAGSRLAVCGMDWDRVSATDIMVLLSSFKPRGSSIVRVLVIPSDFGLQRMTAEDIQGPAELLEGTGEGEGVLSGVASSHGQSEGSGYSSERLRQYQLQRLKYYYARVDCDSKATAEHIYNECDGLEFERSGGRLDLQFIPDSMTFDDREPKSVAMETNVPVDYIPPDFFTSALQQSQVRLTWDETDRHRLQATMKKFSKEDVLKMDFDAYLASSDDSDENGSPGEVGESPKKGKNAPSNKAAKYRSLIGEDGEGVREEEGEEEEEGEMEVTWEPGLRERAEKIVRQKKSERENGVMKKVKKKKAKAEEKDNHGNESVSCDQSSDGGLGFNDPFFQQDVAMESVGLNKNTKKQNKSQSQKMMKKKEEKDEKGSQGELELLLMGDQEEEEEGKAHFSLQGILKKERESSKKKRRKRKEQQTAVQADTFEVDVKDSRFSALYDSHLYAPDPVHPHFKNTKGMEAIMSERRVRREKGRGKEKVTQDAATAGSDFTDPSVGLLVKAVKAKTKHLTEKRQSQLSRRPAIHM